MRKIITILSAPILLAAGIATAGTAAAATVNGGTLTDGKSVTGTISTTNQNIQYTFAGTSGLHETLDVTATNWGSSGKAELDVYTPPTPSHANGILAIICPIVNTATHCDFTPTTTGTWKVVLQPVNNAVGSTTFALAADVTKTLVSGAAATTTAITHKGQQAVYTYAATAGQPFVANVTATNWGTGGTARLLLYPPNSTILKDQCLPNGQPLSTSPAECTFNPNVTGNWRLVLAPQNAATGSITLNLVNFLSPGTLAPNVATNVATTVPAQNAQYSFAAIGSRHTSIDVSANTWGTHGGADLRLYSPATAQAPNGVYELACPITAATASCEFTPKSSGTWKLVLDPRGQITGTGTFTLAPDIAATLTSGQTVNATYARGQGASYSFAATSGSHFTFAVTATNWGSSSAYLALYDEHMVAQEYCALTTVAEGCDLTAPSTGTYTAKVLPQSGSGGTLAFTYANDVNGGTLTAGHAVTSTIGLLGQSEVYTVTAHSGDVVQIDTSASNWGGGNARLWFYRPGTSTGAYDSCILGSGPSACATQLNLDGNWRIVVDPEDNATGSATFTLSFPTT
jgi:hypothetical protein